MAESPSRFEFDEAIVVAEKRGNSDWWSVFIDDGGERTSLGGVLHQPFRHDERGYLLERPDGLQIGSRSLEEACRHLLMNHVLPD